MYEYNRIVKSEQHVIQKSISARTAKNDDFVFCSISLGNKRVPQYDQTIAEYSSCF